MVAAPPASAIGSSRSWRPLPMTSSITYFDDAGSTRPARRLTSIRPSPSARRPRCAWMSSRASRQAAPAETFFFAASGAGRPRRRPTRSACRALGVDERIRAIVRVLAQVPPTHPWPYGRGSLSSSAFGMARVNGAISASKVAPSGVVIV